MRYEVRRCDPTHGYCSFVEPVVQQRAKALRWIHTSFVTVSGGKGHSPQGGKLNSLCSPDSDHGPLSVGPPRRSVIPHHLPTPPPLTTPSALSTPSLGYHVLLQNFSHLHQTVSEEKHPYDFQKLTHLPMLFFPSLFLLLPTFSSLNIIISDFCFPFSSLPCHKMYSDFSIKTVTITFSPLLLP